MRLLATVVALSCLAASAVEVRARGHASNVTIHYSMQDVVSLHEPVVLMTTVANETAAAATVLMGRNFVGAMHLAVLSPDRRETTAEPGEVIGIGGLFFQGELALAPAEAKAFRVVLNKWFEFEQIGTYELTVRSDARAVSGQGLAVPVEGASTRIRFTVIARDSERLASRAASLLKIITDSTNWNEVKEAAAELASIRDAVAVQPLGEALAAQRGVDGISIDGLARIANDEAIQILRHATQSSDAGTASAAKTALRRLGKG
jgi:hypothetical protein